LPIDKIFHKLQADQNGLSSAKVKARREKYGSNKLPEEKRLGALIILLSQFKSPLVYVLLAAAAISFILQDFVDMGIILAAVFLNTILGFYQENKANKSIAYLRRLVEQKAKVLRDGNEILIKASELVSGDIIFLAPGDKISADCRLITVQDFQATEASLTGESMPSNKTLKVLARGAPLAERENMVYSGTVVSRGKAAAIVCETGLNTELGQITQLIKDTKEEKTPLQKQLAVFSKNLTYVVIFICGLIVILGKIQGRPIFGFGEAAREGMLNLAAAVAVAAIPEGLLVSVTAILAVGMQAILKEKALIRRLIAAETLGSVSIICSDKTGTLTEGKMQVAKIVTIGQDLPIKHAHPYEDNASLEDHDLIIKIALLCNNAVIENPQDELNQWRVIGDPTESALLMAAIESGIPYEKIKGRQSRLKELAFSSETKYMATLNRLDPEKNVIYAKGAPEMVLAMCSKIRTGREKKLIDEPLLKSLKAKYENLTKQGLRLLAFAYKQLPPDKNADLNKELSDLTFVGFIALKDPLRPEAKETMALAKKAGIRPIIVTGDHKLTAKAIVSELGIKIEEKNILAGADLDQLSDEELAKRIKIIDIYARVEPRHKLRIIKAWQDQGQVVAMTGDGVNDAPALKAADVGIALNSGTDVAKETSDIILLDDNFKTIVSAIRQGRVIFDNIKKIILYLLADSFSEIILVVGSLILALPLPILPAQIIWINLIDDGLPNLALIFEKGEKEIMREKPRKKDKKIMDREMKTLIFIIGLFVNLALLGLFYYLSKSGLYSINYIRTLIFALLGVDSLAYVFSCRSLRHSIFSQNPLTNLYLLGAVGLGFFLQLLAIYEPHLQSIFQTVNLAFFDWALIAGVVFLQIAGIEIAKFYFIVKKIKAYA